MHIEIYNRDIYEYAEKEKEAELKQLRREMAGEPPSEEVPADPKEKRLERVQLLLKAVEGGASAGGDASGLGEEEW